MSRLISRSAKTGRDAFDGVLLHVDDTETPMDVDWLGLDWMRSLSPQHSDGTVPERLLPFQPRSFRDCMLYERHWIDASRGYVRRFMPWAKPWVQAFEWATRHTFPAFRPHRLSGKQPLYYMGNHLSFVPSGTPVRAPSYSRALDYELELGWVLCKSLRNATPEEALDAIGGFVVVNDWSARDIQRAEMSSGFGPQKCKHFLSSMSTTMALPRDILARVDSLCARVEINGATVARSTTAGMRYSIGEVLAYLSQEETLWPGELIASGTLPGCCGLENGHWPMPGDCIKLVIDEVGVVEHFIEPIVRY